MEIDEQVSLGHLLLQERKCKKCGGRIHVPVVKVEKEEHWIFQPPAPILPTDTPTPAPPEGLPEQQPEEKEPVAEAEETSEEPVIEETVVNH